MSKGQLPALVDAVLADPHVGTDGDLRSRWPGLVPGLEGDPWWHPAPGSMRPHVVVVGEEAIDLGLQLPARGRLGLLGKERLHRLVEPLDLAAGLGVVGPRVAVVDPESPQFGLTTLGPT